MAKKKWWDEQVYFKDSLITVYEVRDTFPTIFFMQEIVEEFEVKINCVQEASRVVKSKNQNLRNVIQAFNQKSNRQTRSTLELKALYDSVSDNLNIQVNDGVRTYISLFFPKAGYFNLDSMQPQFLQLLELFKAIEKFLDTLGKGLELLQAAKSELFESRIIDKEQLVKTSLMTYFNQLDEFKQMHRDIGDRNQLDFLMAQERDEMESDSEDSELD